MILMGVGSAMQDKGGMLSLPRVGFPPYYIEMLHVHCSIYPGEETEKIDASGLPGRLGSAKKNPHIFSNRESCGLHIPGKQGVNFSSGCML